MTDTETRIENELAPRDLEDPENDGERPPTLDSLLLDRRECIKQRDKCTRLLTVLYSHVMGVEKDDAVVEDLFSEIMKHMSMDEQDDGAKYKAGIIAARCELRRDISVFVRMAEEGEGAFFTCVEQQTDGPADLFELFPTVDTIDYMFLKDMSEEDIDSIGYTPAETKHLLPLAKLSTRATKQMQVIRDLEALRDHFRNSSDMPCRS